MFCVWKVAVLELENSRVNTIFFIRKLTKSITSFLILARKIPPSKKERHFFNTIVLRDIMTKIESCILCQCYLKTWVLDKKIGICSVKESDCLPPLHWHTRTSFHPSLTEQVPFFLNAVWNVVEWFENVILSDQRVTVTKEMDTCLVLSSNARCYGILLDEWSYRMVRKCHIVSTTNGWRYERNGYLSCNVTCHKRMGAWQKMVPVQSKRVTVFHPLTHHNKFSPSLTEQVPFFVKYPSLELTLREPSRYTVSKRVTN